MTIRFEKYQGCGNDFIIIDNRKKILSKKNKKLFRNLCDRRFGIGADGVILIQHHKKAEFEMVYFNSDGNLSSMCGNGGRCAVKFAKENKIIQKNTTSFIAYDGLHDAKIQNNRITISMQNVNKINVLPNSYELNTGSPHWVKFVNNLQELDVIEVGKKIRNSLKYRKEGINVNFVQLLKNNVLFVRTYERGVENETLSCGTGVVASALAAAQYLNISSKNQKQKIKTLGGELVVTFSKDKDNYTDIFLIGPAICIFGGSIHITKGIKNV